jgi:hypothetical protein
VLFAVLEIQYHFDLSKHSFFNLYLFSEIIKSLLNDVRRNIEHVIFFLPTSTPRSINKSGFVISYRTLKLRL